MRLDVCLALDVGSILPAINVILKLDLGST
jgi:hypothetical protein